MSDDKSSRSGLGQKRGLAEEPYEVMDFARKHKLTKAQATRLLKDSDGGRGAADKSAEEYKRRRLV